MKNKYGLILSVEQEAIVGKWINQAIVTIIMVLL